MVWGDNERGQLGLGNGALTTIERPLKMPFLRQITKVSLGRNHAAMLTDDRQLFMTGDNSAGQLGIGSDRIAHSSYPTMATTLASKQILDVACGDRHTVVLSQGKMVFGFGANEKGQISGGPAVGPADQLVSATQLCMGE